jgi:hypothetical protein
VKITKIVGLIAIVAAMGLSACAGKDSTQSPQAEAAAVDAASAQTAISEAEAAVKKAASVGYEWRDTGDILAQAKAALKAGDNAKAAKLAGEAKRQGELAHAQYLSQKDVTGS